MGKGSVARRRGLGRGCFGGAPVPPALHQARRLRAAGSGGGSQAAAGTEGCGACGIGRLRPASGQRRWRREEEEEEEKEEGGR